MIAIGGEALIDVADAPQPAEPELLEAEELRLLAAAVGDHLPIELAERVEAPPPARAPRRRLARARRAAAGRDAAAIGCPCSSTHGSAEDREATLCGEPVDALLDPPLDCDGG